MKLLRLVASLFLSMAAAGGARADVIDHYVRAAMAQQRTPGLVLAISSPKLGEVIRPYGLANLEHQVPVRPETIFQSGSTGKQFTAAAVLLQVDDGKLKLDDSIAQYFPSERASWRAITIRHLLSHTSGLPDYDTEATGGLDLRRDYSEDELVHWAMKLEPEFAPGARWSYSNTGYVVLGALIRKVSGKFYGDVLRERIFAPAQMHTARVISETDLVTNRAAGYELVDGGVRNQRWVSPTLNTTADGSLYLSARDWLAWDAVLRARRFLSRESYESMWTPVRLSNGHAYPYGFGWFIEEQRGSPLIEHGGTWQGFHAHIARYVERELTIIALCNIDTCRPTRIAHHVAGLVDSALQLLDPMGADTQPARSERLERALTAWAAEKADAGMAPAFAANIDTSPRAKEMHRQVREQMADAKLRCVGEDDVRKRNIERNGGRATRIVHCNLVGAGDAHGVKFYLDERDALIGIYFDGW
jgi:CubicO group peptidase (beta-lactamase class C family)